MTLREFRLVLKNYNVRTERSVRTGLYLVFQGSRSLAARNIVEIGAMDVEQCETWLKSLLQAKEIAR